MLKSLIENALHKRAELIARTDLDAYRLVHGEADGAAGLVVERLGPVLIAQIHEERLRAPEMAVRAALEWLQKKLGTRAVYRKHFVKDRASPSPDIEHEHHEAEPWIGEPVQPEIPILENGLRYLVRPYDGFSTGIFLEQRDNRRRVRELSAGRRVLNTFSYTCGFSVAAAAGGAAGVDSVDLSRRYLEWGRVNFATNGLDASSHWFFSSDVLAFYKRAERQGRRYDLVVLDPPSFARLRRPQRSFVLEDQLQPLCRGAIDLLNPGGVLLLSLNHRETDFPRMEAAIRSALGQQRANFERLPLPPDFTGDPEYSKSLLIRLDARR